jgi:multiple sugar transport system substrate-binding protein
MKKNVIKGITWGHSRGYTPLVACAQRYQELHPDIEISWTKRTLQEFADFSIESLAKQYDLLVFDHPWIGNAAKVNCLLKLNEHLPKDFLKNQEENTVGGSFKSYEYEGSQWALAIDAATPAASYRPDLFLKYNYVVPANWDDLIELAKKGKVAISSAEVDLALHFLMFCISAGEYPFSTDNEVISLAKGKEALQYMRQLWSLCDKEIFGLNPIQIAELMTTSDKYWYCPFAYCYSNYSREGYAEKQLTYCDMVSDKKHGRFMSTLGGAGLAISASTKEREACLNFTKWITSPIIQRTLYAEHGGQPGHREAWVSEKLNGYMNNFFLNTLSTLDRAYVRPRYHGFNHFQDNAGKFIKEYLLNSGDEKAILQNLNDLYFESLSKRDSI